MRKEEATAKIQALTDDIQNLRLAIKFIEQAKGEELNLTVAQIQQVISAKIKEKQVVLREWEKACRFFIVNSEGRKISCEYARKLNDEYCEVWVLVHMTVETSFFELIRLKNSEIKRMDVFFALSLPDGNLAVSKKKDKCDNR